MVFLTSTHPRELSLPTSPSVFGRNERRITWPMACLILTMPGDFDFLRELRFVLRLRICVSLILERNVMMGDTSQELHARTFQTGMVFGHRYALGSYV